MSSIAVIGAGIFGSEISIQLARAGHDVDLFERSSEILSAGTYASQNRLHLGLHYPRDLPTAKQSRIGYAKFVERFPSTVRLDFPNYYAISKTNSKVDATQFEKFAEQAEIEIEAQSMQQLEAHGVNTGLIQAAYKCSEGVIDISILKSQLLEDLSSTTTQLYLNEEISVCNFSNDKWNLESESQSFGNYDAVVRATYGSDCIRSNITAVNNRQYEFHQTLILSISSKMQTFGYTVVDGDFLTLLPRGFSDDFLIYGPSVSVIERHVGSNVPESWRSVSEEQYKNHEAMLISRFEEYIPGMKIDGIAESLRTIRSIQPNKNKTDERISEIQFPHPKFFDVLSGKIDHCVDISEVIVNSLTNRIK